jgi:protein-S-isoprenylcysteine O-methyltransferase Ste14
MRGYAAVNGATVGHRLVTAGPYRRMRHPIYTAMIAIAVGTALVFASWLLAAVATLSIAVHRWWATAEEQLFASDSQLGEEYPHLRVQHRPIPSPAASLTEQQDEVDILPVPRMATTRRMRV